jgi:LPXTG-motif cell wall-anchored protein
MDQKRLFTAILISIAILLGYQLVARRYLPQPPEPTAQSRQSALNKTATPPEGGPATGAPAAPAAPAAEAVGDQPSASPQPEPVTNSAKGATRADARAAATRTVVMRNIKFNPRDIAIDPGDTVRWENDDSEKHNAIGEDGKFETPVIGEGESSQHTFNSPGKIEYFCSLHANMDGTITVRGSGGGGGGSGGGGGGGSGGGGGGSDDTSNGAGGASGGGSTGSTGSTGSIFTPSESSSPGGSSSSSLPATGEDLPWLALLGYGLLALGALLRLFVFSRE